MANFARQRHYPMSSWQERVVQRYGERSTQEHPVATMWRRYPPEEVGLVCYWNGKKRATSWCRLDGYQRAGELIFNFKEVKRGYGIRNSMIKDTNQNPTDTKLQYIEQAAISSARANKELDLSEKAAAVHVIAGEERATMRGESDHPHSTLRSSNTTDQVRINVNSPPPVWLHRILNTQHHQQRRRKDGGSSTTIVVE